VDDVAGKLRFDDDWLPGEVQAVDAADVGVFDREKALAGGGVGVGFQVVTQAAKRAAHHLFADQLGAEGAQAENVGDVIGNPAFCEHGDRNHAAERRQRNLAGRSRPASDRPKSLRCLLRRARQADAQATGRTDTEASNFCLGRRPASIRRPRLDRPERGHPQKPERHPAQLCRGAG
jgi:hypothetical protein